MKMYILILDGVPDEYAPVISAHGSLICHLKFYQNDEYNQWLSSSFKKVVCKVNKGEFEKAKEIGDYVEIQESSLDNRIVGIVFRPRKEWLKVFNFMKKWKPKTNENHK